MRLLIFTTAGAIALALAACNKAPEVAASVAPAEPAAPFINELDVGEIMVHTMDPPKQRELMKEKV